MSAAALDDAGADLHPDLRPDLRHVDTWLFDLDDTLYPTEAGFMRLIDARITAFTLRLTGLPHDAARALQKRYLREHGTTLAGLMAHHDVDPHAFLADVHDVALDSLAPDPALRAALLRLRGRRLVCTNGSSGHAARVLDRLALSDAFQAVVALEAMGLVPKPNAQAFARLAQAHAVAPATTAFFEDSPVNLAPAAALGMTTVLVGPLAEGEGHGFVAHRARHLAPFLQRARLATPPA